MPHTYTKVHLDAFLRALGRNRNRRPASLKFGIATFLHQKAPRVVSCRELVDWIYGDDPEGGPDEAERIVRQGIRQLRGAGIPIRRHGYRGYSLKSPSDAAA